MHWHYRRCRHERPTNAGCALSCGDTRPRGFITHALGFLAHLPVAGICHSLAWPCAHAPSDGLARGNRPRAHQDVLRDDFLQWLLTALVLWRAFARGLSLNKLGIGHARSISLFVVTFIGAALIAAAHWANVQRMASSDHPNLERLRALGARLFPRSKSEMALFSGTFAYRWRLRRIPVSRLRDGRTFPGRPGHLAGCDSFLRDVRVGSSLSRKGW